MATQMLCVLTTEVVLWLWVYCPFYYVILHVSPPELGEQSPALWRCLSLTLEKETWPEGFWEDKSSWTLPTGLLVISSKSLRIKTLVPKVSRSTPKLSWFPSLVFFSMYTFVSCLKKLGLLFFFNKFIRCQSLHLMIFYGKLGETALILV